MWASRQIAKLEKTRNVSSRETTIMEKINIVMHVISKKQKRWTDEGCQTFPTPTTQLPKWFFSNPASFSLIESGWGRGVEIIWVRLLIGKLGGERFYSLCPFLLCSPFNLLLYMCLKQTCNKEMGLPLLYLVWPLNVEMPQLCTDNKFQQTNTVVLVEGKLSLTKRTASSMILQPSIIMTAKGKLAAMWLSITMRKSHQYSPVFCWYFIVIWPLRFVDVYRNP